MPRNVPALLLSKYIFGIFFLNLKMNEIIKKKLLALSLENGGRRKQFMRCTLRVSKIPMVVEVVI